MMSVCVAVRKSGLARKNVRQHEEMRQIIKFQTLAPRGINRDFSFIWSLETRVRILRTRKQFQNGARMQITISLFYVAA